MSPVRFFGPCPLQARFPKPSSASLGGLLFSGILIGLIGVPTVGTLAVAPAAVLIVAGFGWAALGHVVHALHRERLATRISQAIGVKITTADFDRLDEARRAVGDRPTALPFERDDYTVIFETSQGQAGMLVSVRLS